MTTQRFARRTAIVGLVLAVPLATGCPERTGTVSGTVTFANKPLPGGIITFAPAQQGHFPMSAPIDEQGHYQVTLAVGEYQIAVDNQELDKKSHAGPPPKLPAGIKLPPPAKADTPAKEKEPAVAGRYVAIPKKYYSASTSGLTYSVTAGPQPHDIELK